MQAIKRFAIASIWFFLSASFAYAQQTVTALGGSSNTPGAVVYVQGYYTVGDGGAGPWRYASSGCGSVTWCVPGSSGSWTFVGGGGGTWIDWRQLGAVGGNTPTDPNNNNASKILIAYQYGCSLGTTNFVLSYVPVWGGGLSYGVEATITAPACRGVNFGHGVLKALNTMGTPGTFPPPVSGWSGCTGCVLPVGMLNLNNNINAISDMIVEDLTLNGNFQTGISDLVTTGGAEIQVRHSEIIGFYNYGIFNDNAGLTVSADTQVSQGSSLTLRTGIGIWTTGNDKAFKSTAVSNTCINLWIDPASQDVEIPNSRMFNGATAMDGKETPQSLGATMSFTANTTSGSNRLTNVSGFSPGGFSWGNISCGMRVASSGNTPIPPGSFIIGYDPVNDFIWINNNALSTRTAASVTDYGFAPINVLDYGAVPTMTGVFDCGAIIAFPSSSSPNQLKTLNATGMTFEWGPTTCGNQEGWLVAWATETGTQGTNQPFALQGNIPPITNPFGANTNEAGEPVNTVNLMQGYCPGCTGNLGSWSQTALMGAAAVNSSNSANSHPQIELNRTPACPSFTADSTNGSATLNNVSLGSCTWAQLALGYGVNGTGLDPAVSYHIVWMDPVAGTMTLDNNATSTHAGTTVNVNEQDYLLQAQDSGADYYCVNGSTVQSMTMPALPVGWTAKFYTASISGFGGTLKPQTASININGSSSPVSLTVQTPYVFDVPGQNNATVK
jgi:hypothetical protein